MGVPSFYRWLVNKYPCVVVKAKEERKDRAIDTATPNPNGIEFDNLYLDMNGIIHPCFHSDDFVLPPTTFKDVFDNIFEYIDHLFSIVRPRNLLYMSIDGVAPRAKMNQQRSRRFQTAKANEIAEQEEDKLRRKFEMEGKELLPKMETEISDSNIITPGTKFMFELSKALQGYILSRMNKDSGWKDIKVILSDANVPGEGEHKIMSFIRQQRNLPDYNPNSRHCIYGLDADLIMLSLATHEVHFSVLREDVLVQEERLRCESALQTSLYNEDSSLANHTRNQNTSLIKKPYEFVQLWILREYLELDMKILDPQGKSKELDIERLIDDFIFICFFAGNDFLPHMPTLEIHEGAIDLLTMVYKEKFHSLGGYLVDTSRVDDKHGGFVKLKRVEKFILLVGSFEDKIFKKRLELREGQLKRLLFHHSKSQDEDMDSNQELNSMNIHCPPYQRSPSSIALGTVPIDNVIFSNEMESPYAENKEIIKIKNTKELKDNLKDFIRSKSDLFKKGGLGGLDKVKLGTVGSKQRYYQIKFPADSPDDIERIRKAIVQSYTEGLLWVLLYYFSEIPSWTWFYPYHYGPFASDLKGMSQVKVKFQKGLPFKPFDQLMAVLPPRSAGSLPKPYGEIMTNDQSNIIDFYPADFEVDCDGKRFLWQGVCKLPFIDEERLLSETRKIEKELEETEALRNTENSDLLYKRNTFISTCPQTDCGNVGSDYVSCVLLEVHPTGRPHIPRPLSGTVFPVKTLTEDDIVKMPLWHEYQGNKPSVSRWKCQKKQRNPIDGGKLPLTPNSFSEVVVHKNAGSGWGGREKSLQNIDYVVHKEAGSGWGGRGKSLQITDYEVTSLGYSEQKVVNPSEVCKGTSFRSVLLGCNEQKAVNSSWVSQRGDAHPTISSCNSSLNSLNLHGTPPPNQQRFGSPAIGRGRAQQQTAWNSSYAWRHNSRPYANNPSIQHAQGRNQYVPSPPTTKWIPRSDPKQSSTTERRAG